jgi:Glutamine synthetase
MEGVHGDTDEVGKQDEPAQVIERAKAQGVQVVDVRFIDLPGTWQHFSLPIGELEVDSFTEGLGFDGSSIRGFQAIDESDMLLIPDPDSATIDPCLTHKTLFLICDVIDPLTREPYSRDARFSPRRPRSTCGSPASPT